ncbi:hypothetical protein DSM104299_01465 [Baekduia alba]|uniref:hypothetical protein n=1 Tax=Baekduia alba TaxID=2997333 RepID=UPI002341586A|nr:hypothetical protein [Baekduia alba]WCB92766.1 hypothetical protein DSM104299_01465 [Baekduia alba]
MAFLFRLPLMLLELLLRRLLGGDDDARVAPIVTDQAARDAATPAPPPPPPGGGAFTGTGSANGGAPPPTADEAIARRRARDEANAAAPDPGPPTPLRPIGGSAAAGHLDTEPTVVESFGDPDDVGGTITVDPPWPGYDGDTATAIVARLRDADNATKGVVALYEAAHKGRKTVLKAAG